MEPKPASVSESAMDQMVMPGHLNGGGCLFGGQLMAWMDLAAGAAAHRHSEGPVLTAGCEIRFLAPAHAGDLLRITARVAFGGQSSMEVLVRAGRGADTIALGRLTLVAVDVQGRPRPVPPLCPQTEGEKRDYLLAQRRYLRRKRMEGA